MDKNNFQTTYISKISLFCLVMGAIIGFGSFTLPGTTFLSNSGLINTAIGFICGGLLIIIIQNSYHIMLKNHDKEGGEFSYIYEYQGKVHGFIVGWSLSLCYISLVPLNATAFNLIISKVFNINTQYLFLYHVGQHPVYLSEIIISTSILLLFTLINLRGLKLSAFVQQILVLFMIANILIILFFYLIKVDSTPLTSNYVENFEWNWNQIFKIMAIAPFAFVGFDVIPQVTSHFKFSQKKATLIAIIAIIVAIVFYTTLTLLTAYDFHLFQDNPWPLINSIQFRMGPIGMILLLLAVLGAVIGGINGFMISGGKLLTALSEHHFLNSSYQLTNRYGVNHKSLLFIFFISIIAPWFGRQVIIYIVDMTAVLASIAYLYVCYQSIYLSHTLIEKILCYLGVLFSCLFIALLLIPGSPAFLSNQALFLLVGWGVLGLFYFKRSQILVSKNVQQSIKP